MVGRNRMLQPQTILHKLSINHWANGLWTRKGVWCQMQIPVASPVETVAGFSCQIRKHHFKSHQWEYSRFTAVLCNFYQKRSSESIKNQNLIVNTWAVKSSPLNAEFDLGHKISGGKNCVCDENPSTLTQNHRTSWCQNLELNYICGCTLNAAGFQGTWGAEVPSLLARFTERR